MRVDKLQKMFQKLAKKFYNKKEVKIVLEKYEFKRDSLNFDQFRKLFFDVYQEHINQEKIELTQSLKGGFFFLIFFFFSNNKIKIIK